MKGQIYTSIIRVGSKESKKTGEAPLWLKIHFGGSGKRKHYSLVRYKAGTPKLSATKGEWDDKSSRYKKDSDPRNKVLFDIERKIADYMDEIRYKRLPFTLDRLEKELFKVADLTSCYSLFEAHIKYLDSDGWNRPKGATDSRLKGASDCWVKGATYYRAKGATKFWLRYWVFLFDTTFFLSHRFTFQFQPVSSVYNPI